jgi:hypothetical protein
MVLLNNIRGVMRSVYSKAISDQIKSFREKSYERGYIDAFDFWFNDKMPGLESGLYRLVFRGCYFRGSVEFIDQLDEYRQL